MVSFKNVLPLIFLCFTNTFGSKKVVQFNKQTNSLEISLENVLKNQPICSTSVFTVVLGGAQGVGKSTEARAVGQYLEIPESSFKSANQFSHCTEDISSSEVNKNGIMLLDQPGAFDPSFSGSVKLSSESVDTMFSSLLAPITNVLIYAVKDGLKTTDMDALSSFAGKHHLGELGGVSRSVKPKLILTLRSNKEGSANELFQRIIPKDHPLRKIFHSINFILFEDYPVNSEAFSFLSNDNFQPQKVPSYWNNIKTIGDAITSHISMNSAQFAWTGCEINDVLVRSLPSVNAMKDLDIPTTYKYMITQRVLTQVNLEATEISKLVKPYLTDPLTQPVAAESFLNDLNQKAKDRVKQKFTFFKDDESIYKLIQSTINTEFDKKKNEHLITINNRIVAIRSDAQKAFELAKASMTATKNSAILTGNPKEVNCQLRKSLTDSLDKYRTDITKIQVEANQKTLKEEELKKFLEEIITSKHNENEIIHQNNYRSAYDTLLPSVQIFLEEYHKACANSAPQFSWNLREKYPQYFGEKVAKYLSSVRAKTKGHDECEGNLSLTGGESLVCNGWSSFKSKYKKPQLYVNPSTGVARVILEIGGFGSGCNNYIDFYGIVFTIQQRKIAQHPELADPYDRNVKC